MQRYCKSTLNPTWCTLRYIVQLSRSPSRKNAAWLDQSTNSQPCRCLNTDPKHEEADARRKRQDTIMNVFDRKAKRIQRDRAAMAENHQVFDYIKDEVYN